MILSKEFLNSQVFGMNHMAEKQVMFFAKFKKLLSALENYDDKTNRADEINGLVHEMYRLAAYLNCRDLIIQELNKCVDQLVVSRYLNLYYEIIAKTQYNYLEQKDLDIEIEWIIKRCEFFLGNRDKGICNDHALEISRQLDKIIQLSPELNKRYVCIHKIVEFINKAKSIDSRTVTESASTDMTGATVSSDSNPNPVKGYSKITSADMNDYFKYFYSYRNDSNYMINGLKLLELFAKELLNDLSVENMNNFSKSISIIVDNVKDNRTAINELTTVLSNILTLYRQPKDYMLNDSRNIDTLCGFLEDKIHSLKHDEAMTESVLHEFGLGFYYDIFPMDDESNDDALMETFIAKINDCDQDELYDTMLENIITDIYDRHARQADKRADDRYDEKRRKKEKKTAEKEGKSDSALDKMKRLPITNKYAHNITRLLKNIIGATATVPLLGPVLPSIVFMNKQYGSKASEKERASYVQKVRQELEVLEHKIAKAESSGNDKELHRLLRIRDKLKTLYTTANFSFNRRVMS